MQVLRELGRHPTAEFGFKVDVGHEAAHNGDGVAFRLGANDLDAFAREAAFFAARVWRPRLTWLKRHVIRMLFPVNSRCQIIGAPSRVKARQRTEPRRSAVGRTRYGRPERSRQARRVSSVVRPRGAAVEAARRFFASPFAPGEAQSLSSGATAPFHPSGVGTAPEALVWPAIGTWRRQGRLRFTLSSHLRPSVSFLRAEQPGTSPTR